MLALMSELVKIMYFSSQTMPTQKKGIKYKVKNTDATGIGASGGPPPIGFSFVLIVGWLVGAAASALGLAFRLQAGGKTCAPTSNASKDWKTNTLGVAVI